MNKILILGLFCLMIITLICVVVINDDYKDYEVEGIMPRIHFGGMPSTYEQYKQYTFDNKIKDMAKSKGVIIG